MELVTYRLSLDIHETCTAVRLQVKKNDTARRLCLTLTQGGKPYTIAPDCSAVFRGKREDGTVYYNACTVTDNAIFCPFTQGFTAAAGLVDCEITLYGATGLQLASPVFTMEIVCGVYDDITVENSSEFTALTELYTTVQDKLRNGEFKGDKGEKGEKGDPGETGAQGPAGDTPQRGVDYWTQADVAAMESYIDSHTLLPVLVSAEGSLIHCKDGSERPLRSLTVQADTDTVQVEVWGKNLLTFGERTDYSFMNAVVNVRDNVIAVKGTCTGLGRFPVLEKRLLPAGTYTVSAGGVFGGSHSAALQFCNADADNAFLCNQIGYGDYLSYAFTLTQPTRITVFLIMYEGAVLDATVRFQLEAGDTATAVENPVCQTATVDTATQTGWERLHTYGGITNILCPAGTVQCTYVADTKRYIDNQISQLRTALLALGG